MLVQAENCNKKMTVVLIILFVTILNSLTNTEKLLYCREGMLISHPCPSVLFAPSFDKGFKSAVDASDVGAGSVL